MGKDRTEIAHPARDGICCSRGKVSARLMQEAEPHDFLSRSKNEALSDSGNALDTDSNDPGIAFNGHICRMKHVSMMERQNAPSTDAGLHNFGNYLTKRLASRRGIRRNRIPLHLAEWVWRFNH